jgi:CRISPR-associated protein Cmr3
MYLSIQPHDPLIARDARPFGSGGRARTLDWPYPSMVVGSLRTLLGKLTASEDAFAFPPEQIEALKQLKMTGPFLSLNGQLHLVAPRDIVLYRQDNLPNNPLKAMPLRPQPLSGAKGCNLPSSHLWPIRVTEDVKAAGSEPFWHAETLYTWLLNDSAHEPQPHEMSGALVKEERVHVALDLEKNNQRTAQEGQLYQTSGLVFADFTRADKGIADAQMLVKVESDIFNPHLHNLRAAHPLGGERRLATFTALQASHTWAAPANAAAKLAAHRGVRMLLISPAYFEQGWLPDWIDPVTLQGCVPNTQVKVQLRSACVDRWKPLSGWSLERGKRGPKPTRRLVSAGSVYFFEVLAGEAGMLADQWFESVCSVPQDRHDGFGTALWGTWNMA